MKRYISLQNEWRTKWVNERTNDNDWIKNEDMRDKKKGRILFQRNKSIMQLNTCKEQLNEKKHPSNEKKHPLFADIESSAQFSTSEMFSKYEAALSQLLDTFVPVCSKKGQGTSYYCRWITYETFNFDWIRVTVCPPLGSTRVAEPFDDRLGALREFSGEHAVRRIGHRGSALSGRYTFFISHKRTGVLGGAYFPPVEEAEKTLDHLQQSPWSWERWTSTYELIVFCGDIPGVLYSQDIVDPAFYCGPPFDRRFLRWNIGCPYSRRSRALSFADLSSPLCHSPVSWILFQHSSSRKSSMTCFCFLPHFVTPQSMKRHCLTHRSVPFCFQ